MMFFIIDDIGMLSENWGTLLHWNRWQNAAAMF